MYRLLVERRVASVFSRLSAGDWRSVLAQTAADVHHVFPGDHALGGERHSREAVARWFERLYRLFPGLDFEVRRLSARGWPWSTWVGVEWIDRTTPVTGEPYENRGAHWLHVRWGRVTEIHAYLDTQALVRACERMSAQGIEEAGAAPIVD